MVDFCAGGEVGVTSGGHEDRGPIGFGDRSNRGFDFGDETDRDRPVDTGFGEFVDEFPSPERRIGPDGDRPGHPGPVDRREDLTNEPEYTA